MNKLNTMLAAAIGAAFVAGIAFSPVAVANNTMNNDSQTKQSHRALQHSDVAKAIAKFKEEDPAIGGFFSNAYAYAVYPSVGKGGLIIGGAYGGGEVYKNGRLVGYSTITKFDIGAQIGGQSFSEVVFFKDAEAFDHFTEGNYQFNASISAVAVKSGESATNDYSHGVAVFTKPKAGLMAGVSIGGQKFSYTPLAQAHKANQSGQMNSGNGDYSPANQQALMNGAGDNRTNETQQSRKALQHSDVQSAIAKFRNKDPNIADFFDNAYAYAVFPSVGKGGLVLGGAYGEGEVYQNGDLVGHATITKFDIGAQIGGQTFGEVIFFKDAEAFNHFTEGNYQFNASISAVAVKSGESATNDYSHGVAVFTMPKAGLMAGASIGGQKFGYTPITQSQDND